MSQGQRSCRSRSNKDFKERQVGSQQRQVALYMYFQKIMTYGSLRCKARVADHRSTTLAVTHWFLD